MVVKVKYGERGAWASMFVAACGEESDEAVEFHFDSTVPDAPVAYVNGAELCRGDTIIARAIAAAVCPELLGTDPLARASVDSLTLAPIPPIASARFLEERLQCRTFLSGRSLTIADLCAFALHRDINNNQNNNNNNNNSGGGDAKSNALGVHASRWRDHVSAHTCISVVRARMALERASRGCAAIEAAIAADSGSGAQPAVAGNASGGGKGGAPVSLTGTGAERATDAPTTDVHRRLHALCEADGIKLWRFRRVPSDYYSWTLEQRRAVLGAASTDHLTKSLILRNSDGAESDPDLHILVVVQYTGKLDTTTLNKFFRAKHRRATGVTKAYSYQLAPEEVGLELSGFPHNGVTPLGMRVRLPIVLADAIRKLQPSFFWMGGGEVDLKLGMASDEFVSYFNADVAKI